MAEVNENIKELELVTTSMSNRTAAKAGCNTFALVTTVSDVGSTDIYPIMCNGLLTDLPAFSISPQYDLSPGKSLLDLYTNAFKKDEFDVAAVLMSSLNSNTNETSPWVNSIQAGAMTRGMFKSISYGEFDLKFKIYSQKTFGQSSINEWRDLLTKFATPSKSNAQTVGVLLNNIQGALDHLEAGGERIIETLSAKKNDGSNDSNAIKKRKLVEWKKDNVGIKLSRFCMLLSSTDSPVSISFAGWGERIHRRYGYGEQSVKSIQYTPKFMIGTQEIYLADKFGNDAWSIKNTDKDSTGKMKQNDSYWFIINANTRWGNTEDALSDVKDYNESEFGNDHPTTDNKLKKVLLGFVDKYVNDYLKSIENQNSDTTAKTNASNAKTRIMSTDKSNIEASIDEIVKILDETTIPDDPNANNDMFKNISKHIRSVTEKIDTFMSSTQFLANYDENRVYEELNAKNYLGEKLWHLYIYYPWLFKTPITICITGWSINPAKVIGFDKKPVYYDIEIKCKMDQVPSIDVWDNTFSDFCKAAAKE